MATTTQLGVPGVGARPRVELSNPATPDAPAPVRRQPTPTRRPWPAFAAAWDRITDR